MKLAVLLDSGCKQELVRIIRRYQSKIASKVMTADLEITYGANIMVSISQLLRTLIGCINHAAKFCVLPAHSMEKSVIMSCAITAASG